MSSGPYTGMYDVPPAGGGAYGQPAYTGYPVGAGAPAGYDHHHGIPYAQPVAGGGIPYAQPVHMPGAPGAPQQPASVFVNVGPGGVGHLSHHDALPTAADQPIFEPGAKDIWAAVLFWVHALVIIILAFALGVPAMRADAGTGDADPNRQRLDLNASLFVRMLLLATGVAAGVSALFFHILQRYGGRMIKCSLYTSAGMMLLMAAFTFAFAPVAAVFLLIGAAITLCYIYAVRDRIAFAAANLETACDAVRAHRGPLFTIAIILLGAQALWVFLWAAAALGVSHSVNVNAGAAASNYPGYNATLPLHATGELEAGARGQQPPSQGRASGGILVFLLLISFYWGAQTLKNAMHFITASVVGNWWMLGNVPAVIGGSLHRAFVTNFGTIAFASLITSILRALEAMARSAERRARRGEGSVATAFLAACAVCITRCVAQLAEYFNKWALVYAALTGSKYTHAGSEVIALFRKRGWTAVINDDLTGSAMSIACLMVGAISAAFGGGIAFVLMGDASDGTVAGIAAFLSFLVGIAMASVMTGIISSAVTTVFVCFALNAAALGATHPDNLARLVVAWYAAHPQDFRQCGYLEAYGNSAGGGGGASGGGAPGYGHAGMYAVGGGLPQQQPLHHHQPGRMEDVMVSGVPVGGMPPTAGGYPGQQQQPRPW